MKIEIVQFDDGCYAIRKKENGECHTYASLERGDYWWHIEHGREYYASKNLSKVKRKLAEIERQEAEKEAQSKIRQVLRKDKGKPY